MQTVQVTNVAELLAECWHTAERSTIERCRGASEEEITALFRTELIHVVEAGNRNRVFERAFLRDLQRSFPHAAWSVDQIASGLVGSVNFHTRSHEGNVSGADLGIVIARPQVTYSMNVLQVASEARKSALLAQAKLGLRRKKNGYRWPHFTEAQRRIIPVRSDYYSLLLYRFSDTARTQLLPFGWQLFREHDIEEADRWLREDTFPNEIKSEQVIYGIATEEFGTTKEELISQVIDLHNPATDYLEIRLGWPPGSPRPSSVYVWQSQRAEVQQVHIRR